MALLQNSAPSQVSPSRILGNILIDTVISVKLFYTPYDIWTKVPEPGGATFDLFETLVGADGLEYQLVAMGNTATKALELLERFAGKVVTLRHVRARTYQDFPQLQLLDDFEILPENDSKRQRCLKEQQMKRCSLKQLPLQTRGTKVALLPCAIHDISEKKTPRLGIPIAGRESQTKTVLSRQSWCGAL